MNKIIKLLVITTIFFYLAINATLANKVTITKFETNKQVKKKTVTKKRKYKKRKKRVTRPVSNKTILKKVYRHHKNKNRKKTIRINKINKKGEFNIQKGGKGNKFKIIIKKPSNKLTKKIHLYQKAYIAMQSKNFEVAIVLYKRILRNNKKDKDALLGMAESYHLIGNNKKSKFLYNKLISLYPNDFEVLNSFLSVLVEENPQKALKQFLSLDEIIYNNDVLKAQISYLFVGQKKYSDALRYIQASIQIAKEQKPVYLYNKAIILEHLNLNNDAIKLYKLILDLGFYQEIGVTKLDIQKRISSLI